MESDSIFARNLELVRIAKGYTQENLALDADVARSYLSNLKSGTNSATLEMVDKLARVLEVESWQLLLPDLTVESVEPGQDVSADPMSRPTVLKIVRNQTSKRKLRPS
jgi:transcriptional regulator with XRE-family HTH domain